jgi:hypothetical protein
MNLVQVMLTTALLKERPGRLLTARLPIPEVIALQSILFQHRLEAFG